MGSKNLNYCAAILAPLLILSAPISNAADDCSGIKDLRNDYAALNDSIAKAVHEQVRTETEEIDLEEQGCISDYGIEGSFGLPSLADFGGLMDQICEAADSYISTQLNQFGAKLTSPLGLANVELGFGSYNRCEEDETPETHNCRDSAINMSETTNEIGLDTDSFIDDQFDRLPDVDSSYSDYNYDGGGRVDDYDYGTSSSRRVPEGELR